MTAGRLWEGSCICFAQRTTQTPGVHRLHQPRFCSAVSIFVPAPLRPPAKTTSHHIMLRGQMQHHDAGAEHKNIKKSQEDLWPCLMNLHCTQFLTAFFSLVCGNQRSLALIAAVTHAFKVQIHIAPHIAASAADFSSWPWPVQRVSPNRSAWDDNTAPRNSGTMSAYVSSVHYKN